MLLYLFEGFDILFLIKLFSFYTNFHTRVASLILTVDNKLRIFSNYDVDNFV